MSTSDSAVSALPDTFLCVFSGGAAKLGRKGGAVQFKLLTDLERQSLYLTITGNDGGGCFSNEVVSFAALERCVPVDSVTPFPARSLLAAFKGRSSNQAPFCAAVLASLGLIAAAPDKAHHYVRSGDWGTLSAEMLTKDGDVYVPPVKQSLLGGLAKVQVLPVSTSEPELAAPVDKSDDVLADRPRESRAVGKRKLTLGLNHAVAH